MEITQEQIDRTYAAAMDSVALLQGNKPESMSEEDWAGCKARNVEHLKLVVEWPHMQEKDLQPIIAAIPAE